MNDSELPKVFSVDDHVIKPPDVWERWLPAEYRDRGPHVERRGIRDIEWKGAVSYSEVFDDDSPLKGDVWVYEGLVYSHKRNIAAAGYPKETWTGGPITYDEMRPGCYDAKARIADMDQNWVEFSMIYPTLPRFCGQMFYEGTDKDLGMACVLAYNNWLVEEWCGDSGGRLIPVCIVPLWDVQAAAAEVRRNAARGPWPSARSPTTSGCPACTRTTGIRSSPPVPRRGPSSACTSDPRRACRQPPLTHLRR